MKLRTRLHAVTTLTLGTGLTVACFAGNSLLDHSLANDQHARLNARLQEVTASLSLDRAGHVHVDSAFNDNTLDQYAWIVTQGGRLLEQPSSTSQDLTALAVRLATSGQARMHAPGDILLGRSQLTSRGRPVATVVAGVSTSQFDSLRREVLLGSIAGAAFILLLGMIVVRRALGAALGPVEQMTKDAEDWNAHDLDRRFDQGPVTDEITALAATLDHLLARIASSRRHEQRFAAEVAHELRTPLAAIRGTAELNVDATALAEARAALRQIEDQSRRIGVTLETLMAFARREVGRDPDGVDLEAVVADFDDIEVRRTAPVVPRVEGDFAVIRQTLAPLIDNARRHATARVSVELGAARDLAIVTVRDDGPGIEPGLGEDVFLPGVRGSAETGEGAGLGLPLARRLAASCGGEITIGEGPGGCFVLSLPATVS